MKSLNRCVLLAQILLCSSLAGGADVATKPRPAVRRPPVATTGATPGAPTPEAQPEAIVVQYSNRAVVKIKTKIRYTTLIILPKTEQILDFTCGDKEYWVVNGSENFAYVKPAKAGAETNLNLITASGNVYSFILVEVSQLAGAQPDLKVFIELADGPMTAAASGASQFVSTRVAEDFRQKAELAKEETRQVKQSAIPGRKDSA